MELEGLLGRSLGKYVIIEEIGRGAFGVVYKALDSTLDRVVALKVLAPPLLGEEDFIARFKREAKTAANLKHPNIVVIHEVGEEKGTHYMVMEHLEGEPLSQLIKEQGPLPLPRVLEITRQLADALDYAHGHGFVHRDIKPSNIIIGFEDHATLTDFGIVKAAGDATLTLSGMLVGTPQYMSPEQCEGKEVDRRSDLYSLGIVLYEMLTGSVPFTSSNIPSVLYMHIHEPPSPPRRLNPEVPGNVERVVLGALVKQPEQRYATGADLVKSFEAALSGKLTDEPAPKAVGRPLIEPATAVPAAPPAITPSTPDEETGQPLLVLEGHSDYVRSVAFSPAEATLASGSDDKTVILWDARTGQQLVILQGHTSVVYSVAFSPDGGTLASGSWDNTLILWEVATGRKLRALAGHRAGVDSVAFSPDGAILASGSDDRTLILWDARTGRQLRALEGHAGVVYSVAFSPDRRTLASGSWDRTVVLWHLPRLERLRTLRGHSGHLLSVAFSPDGETLASASSDARVILWHAKRGQRLRTLTGHTDGVRSVAFSPDGTALASGSDDRSVILWDVNSGKKLRSLEGHGALVTSVAFSPDGHTIASGSFDNTVILWDVRPRGGKVLDAER